MRTKNTYDSNIEQGLKYTKNLADFKTREAATRNSTLQRSEAHSLVQNKSQRQLGIQADMEERAIRQDRWGP